MKALYLSALLLVAIAGTQAQTLGEFKPKDQSNGLRKLDKAKDNRIYIANFNVHYQVYNEKQKFKQGGSTFGGGVRGDAKTEVSVGLDGLTEPTLQGITDKLFADYLAKLKAAGMTIIPATEAAKTDSYEDWEMATGGKISMVEIPGAVSTCPTGYQWMIKGVDKKGKSKKGGFLGNEQFIYPKLSKDLGDAIISTVNITVLFVKEKSAFQGNGAKIKIKTDLRIVSSDAISMTSQAAFKMKGQNSVTPVSSTVAFYHGKIGLGSTSSYVGTLGTDFEINDVIEESKIVGYAAGAVDAVGTSSVYGTYYSADSRSTKNAKVIPVDDRKYGEGVYAAAKKFLDHHTDEFLKSI